MMEVIKNRIAAFGYLPICNLKQDRGFFIGSFCFPLCVRCVCIIGAMILTFVLIKSMKLRMQKKYVILWLICIIPCLVDGIMQYAFQIESTNFRRALTGALSGVGIGAITAHCIQFVENSFIKKHKKG